MILVRRISLIVVVLISFSCGNDEKFVSDKWKVGNLRDRGRMAYDLQRSKVLIGKTELEVIDILGKPDSLNYSYRIHTYNPLDIEFWILLDEKTKRVIKTGIGN